MKSECQVHVGSSFGLHLRSCAQLARTANRFRSTIKLTKAGQEWEADAKGVLSLLGLGACAGEAVTIRAEGDDADAAIDALRGLVREDLDGEACPETPDPRALGSPSENEKEVNS